MKKFVLIGLLMCALIFAFRAKTVGANPGDIWVPYDYATIQAAINAANPGDVIHVIGGPYAPIVVNKSVSLVGESEATIEGKGSVLAVVNVTANQVSFKNFKIRNAEDGFGILLENRVFCYLENNQITNTLYGVSVVSSSNIRVVGNTIANVSYGVYLSNSSYNYILTNDVYARSTGISVSMLGYTGYSSSNLVSGNRVTGIYQFADGIIVDSQHNTICNNWINNCGRGIAVYPYSSNHLIYHNNFINNTRPAELYSEGTTNIKWYLDWPAGGNFWSNHTSSDIFSGEYQNQPGSDGICDIPFSFDVNGVDKYPLMGPCNSFEVRFGFFEEEILVISNSSVSAFQVNTTRKTISFNVTGDTGIGLCRVDIPNTIISGLWQSNYTVLVNNEEPLYKRNWTEGSITYVYFQYEHSTKEVIIIPEFSIAPILPLFMMATLVTVIISKRKLKNIKI